MSLDLINRSHSEKEIIEVGIRDNDLKSAQWKDSKNNFFFLNLQSYDRRGHVVHFADTPGNYSLWTAHSLSPSGKITSGLYLKSVKQRYFESASK